MISPQRLDWLLGDRRPTRVIPARVLEGETASDEDAGGQEEHGPHKSLSHHDHQWDHAHDGQVHSKTLRHPDGIVEVHSASLNYLNRHLESVQISMRSRPPAGGDAPQPVFVNRLVADAVATVTGSPVAALVANRGGAEAPLETLLGAAAADVCDVAASALARDLSALEQCAALSTDDCAALDPGKIVEALLREPAGAVAALPPEDHRQLLEGESVLTRFGPAEEGHDLCVSIRDIGSLEVGAGKYKYYRSIGEFMEVEEKVRVTNTDGHMRMTIQYYESTGWKTRGEEKELFKSEKKEKFTRKLDGATAYWHMKLKGEAKTEYDLEVDWTSTMTTSEAKWREAPS